MSEPRKKWMIDMIAEPIVPAWTVSCDVHVNGSELQRAIIKGFSDGAEWRNGTEELSFEKTFTFKEHGEFFRGALTMAGLRYTGDFYELLQRYGTIKVTIEKLQKEDR